MNFKKMIMLLLLLLLIGLVGCGKETEDNDTTNLQMVYWPGPESDAMQKVVDEYNETQGKEDKVNVEMVLISRDGTFEKQATMMSSESDEVDMYFTASYILGQHAPYLEPLGDDLDFDVYLDAAIDSLEIEGEKYAIPMDASTHFMFYRTDYIERLLEDENWKRKYRELSKEILNEEIDPKHPDEWSWDDYIVASAFFTEEVNSESPTKYGTILQMKNLFLNIFLWDNILWSEGGGWFDEQGEVILDSPEAKKAMEVYNTIYEAGYTTPDSTVAEFPEAQAAFSSGNIAFLVQWGTGFDELNNEDQSPNTANKVGIAPVPGKKIHVHGQGIGINKYSDKKEESLKWMEYLTTNKANEIYAEHGGITAVPEVMENFDKNPLLAEISKHIQEYGYYEPTLLETNQILQILADELSPAWVGEVESEDALLEAKNRIESLMND